MSKGDADAPSGVAPKTVQTLTSLDQLETLDDLRRDFVDVKAWDGLRVWVQALDGSDTAEFGRMSEADEDGKKMTFDAETIFWVCVASMCHPEGGLLTPPEPEARAKAIDKLRVKSWDAIEEIFHKALDVAGLSAKSREDAEGKSDASPTD